ncbi:TPA: hypothetical protein ACX6R8_000446 [Photobacterium damselae]
MPRRITPEFKRECADLVITHGYSHKDASAAMNVGLASVIAPNKLNRQFNPEQLNTYWSGDITYIRTQQGW